MHNQIHTQKEVVDEYGGPLQPPAPPPILSLASSSSQSQSKPSKPSPQASRLQSFNHLLDPQDLMPGHTVTDLYALRHLTRGSGGFPESQGGSDWLRPVAWKVLLGLVPVEKKEWTSTLAKRREEYYQFLSDLLPSTSVSDPSSSLQGSSQERDTLLDQIYKDLSRSKKNAFAFFSEKLPVEDYSMASTSTSSQSSSQSSSKPKLTRTNSQIQSKISKKIEIRRKLLKRLASINSDYSSTLIQSTTPTVNSFSLKGKEKETENSNLLPTLNGEEAGSESPHIYLSPPSPGKLKKGGPSSSTSSFSSALEDSESKDEAGEPPQTSKDQSLSEEQEIIELRWHSLLRILYVYAILNPSTGYIQGMNEVAFVILYVLGNSSKSTSTPIQNSLSTSNSNFSEEELESKGLGEPNCTFHSEADAFWCFSALIGEVRELYEFDEIDHREAGLKIRNERCGDDGVVKRFGNGNGNGENGDEGRKKGETGMAGALKRFSRRLFWLDEELWKALKLNSLDPRLPYYSFRWLACIVSTELSLPSLVRVWDSLLTEETGPAQPDPEAKSKDQGDGSAKIEFLIDLCCALLINIRGPLLEVTTRSSTGEEDDPFESSGEAFAKAIHILQDYPDDDIQPVVEMAYVYRQRRLASGLTGDGPPTDDTLLDLKASSSSNTARDKISAALRGWTGNNNLSSPSQSGLGLNGSAPIKGTGSPIGIRTPSSASRWFSSVGRSASGSSNSTLDQDPQTPSLPSSPNLNPASAGTPGGSRMFSRYAEALQSSDAAASLSKTSSNWMASWSNRGTPTNGSTSSPHDTTPNGSPYHSSLRNGTPSSRPGIPSFSSALGAGSEFLKKVRSASGSDSSSSHPSASSHHPASFRWSRDVTPDFPLPNVLDSPDGRTEYVRQRPESGAFFSNRQYSNGMRSSSPTPGSEGGLGSPTFSNGNGSPSLLPSLRSAQQARSASGPPSSLRGAGPKPLLLGGSARPPREGSGSAGLSSIDEPTRKVSSGPLANAAASPEARANAKSRRLSSLSNTSQGGSIGYHHQRVGTSSSGYNHENGNSRRSSMVSSRGSNNGDGDSSTIVSVASSSISVRDAAPPLLPSLAAAMQANGSLPQPLVSPPTSNSTSSSTQGMGMGLQGSGNGKVAAGAFAKMRAANGDLQSSSQQVSKPTSTPPSAWQGSESPSSNLSGSSSNVNGVVSAALLNSNARNSNPQAIQFGQVSSSSDTPLVSTASSSIKSRKPVRRKASASSQSEREVASPVTEGIGLGFNNVTTASPTIEESQYFPPVQKSNSSRGSIASVSSDKKSISSISYSNTSSTPNSNRGSVFEAPRAAPAPPGSATSPPPPKIRSATRKYALTDNAPPPFEKDDVEELALIRSRKSGSITRERSASKTQDDQDTPIDVSGMVGGSSGTIKPSRASGSGISRSRRATQESVSSRDSKGSLTRRSNAVKSSTAATSVESETSMESKKDPDLTVMGILERQQTPSLLPPEPTSHFNGLASPNLPPPSPGPMEGDMLTADELLRSLELEAEADSNSVAAGKGMGEREKALGVPADLNDEDEEEDFMAGHDTGLEGIGNTLAFPDSDEAE